MKLNYETPPRSIPLSTEDATKEFGVPLILLVAGLLIYGARTMCSHGATTAAMAMGIVLLTATLETLVGIVAACVTAGILKTGFGYLRSAFLKLAAIIVITDAIASLLPMAGICVLFTYFGLLVWQFEIDFGEAVIFSMVFALMRWLVLGLVVAWFSNR